MFKKIMLLSMLLLMLFTVQPVSATNWYYVGSSAGSDPVSMFVDNGGLYN
jgi:hypothetical protein